MIRTLPDWYMEAEEKLKNTIVDISNKNAIDYGFVLDSQGIEEGVRKILNRLVAIYESVNVEQRKNIEEFMAKVKFKSKPTKQKRRRK